MIKQAIPTDFMGIRFRSKSEAMFANMLEQLGQSWFYEPSFLKVGDYTPDFISIGKYENDLIVNIIEYKPGKPTRAYLERVMSKAKSISDRTGAFPKSFSIISINFFEPFNVKRLSIQAWRWVEIERHDFTEEMFNRVKTYRYDLEQASEILPEQKVGNRLPVPYSQSIQPAANTIAIHAEESRDKCDRGVSLSVSSVAATLVWRKSLSFIQDMLADYAGLAMAIEIIEEDRWNVVFPPGNLRPKEVCENSDRKSVLERHVARHVGRLISLEFSVAESEWASRFCRLQQVLEYIRSKNSHLCRFIKKLHDHKGDLTCIWSLSPNGVSEDNRNVIELAWRSVGELACNVTHEYTN